MWTLPIQWRANTLTTEVFQINEPGQGVAGGWESEGGCKAASWRWLAGVQPVEKLGVLQRPGKHRQREAFGCLLLFVGEGRGAIDQGHHVIALLIT